MPWVLYTVSVEGSREEIAKGVTRSMIRLRVGAILGFPVEGDGAVKVPVKLWIDTKSNLPAKMEIRWAPAVALGFAEFTETLTFTINGKVDEKVFELPK
jgi:hypothetical protein